MNRSTVVLDGSGLDADLVGGKAAMTDRLIGLGMPVPRSGAVTTDAYAQFVDGARLGDELHRLQATTPSPDEVAIRKVQERFMTAAIPPELAGDIVSLAREVGGTSPLAVRSSATAEDTLLSSFAGQYRSFLDVNGDAELLESVRRVWASLWLPGPIAYRNFRGVSNSPISMGVLVMKMVPALSAGVVFTVDPGGTPDALRIESVDGLGEMLVSGAVTPDAYVIDRFGYDELPQPLPRVVELSLRVERALGTPQDIEWAYDGRRVFIVQARPITTQADDRTDPFDTSPDPTVTYTTAGIAEMVPGVLSPWLWSIAGRLLEEAFRIVYDDLGALPYISTPFGILGRFRGRAATNLDMLKEAASLRPGGSPDELEQQYFKQPLPERQAEGGPDEEAGGRLDWPTIKHSLRELAVRSRFIREADVAVPAVEQLLEASVDMSGMSDRALIAYLHRLVDLGGRIMAAQVGVAAAAAAAYRGLELFFDGRMEDEEASNWVRRLTTGAGESGGGQLIFRLRDLVRKHLDGPLGDLFVQDAPSEQLWRDLAGHPHGPAFVAKWDTIVKRAGSASVFGGETWEELGHSADLLAQAIELARLPHRHLEDQRRESFIQVEAVLTADPKWRRIRWLTGQVVDVRIWILSRMVEDVVSLLTRREHTKMALLRLGGEVRRNTLEIGQRLKHSNVLGDPSEVELLTVFELSAVFVGRRPSPMTLETRARQLAAARQGEPLPLRFVGRPTAPEEDVLEGNVFQGWAGSAGEYTGAAVVVTDPASTLPRGSVLVARTTDASWTPLLLQAGAVVVEEGGPLSHAAIVAREIGMPAVLNLPGLIDRLEGQTVDLTVDGYSGSVTIHAAKESTP